MIKFLAKEFIWLLLTLVLAFPLAFLWLTGLDVVSSERSFTEDEQVFVIELFLLAYAISFIGVYLARMIVAAIKKLSEPEIDK